MRLSRAGILPDVTFRPAPRLKVAARAVEPGGERRCGMRVGIYLRCSTADQDVEVQRDELEAHARQRGWQVARVYEDRRVSGAAASRPGLDRLLTDARRGRVEAVLVWKLDRLGRSLRHLLEVAETLAGLGVGLVSLRDPGVDTTSPAGRLVFATLGACAEFERALLRERVRAGMERAKRRPRPGKRRPGRPRVSIAGDALREARRRLGEGEAVAAVARSLGLPRSSLRRALGLA